MCIRDRKWPVSKLQRHKSSPLVAWTGFCLPESRVTVARVQGENLKPCKTTGRHRVARVSAAKESVKIKNRLQPEDDKINGSFNCNAGFRKMNEFSKQQGRMVGTFVTEGVEVTAISVTENLMIHLTLNTYTQSCHIKYRRVSKGAIASSPNT